MYVLEYTQQLMIVIIGCSSDLCFFYLNAIMLRQPPSQLTCKLITMHIASLLQFKAAKQLWMDALVIIVI